MKSGEKRTRKKTSSISRKKRETTGTTRQEEPSEYVNPWTYRGKTIDSGDIGDNYGFVYLITDTATEKKYVGKKLFFNKKTKIVNKKKKRAVVDSDWKRYYGSNLELIAEIDKNGVQRFKREILHLCKSKGECNYWEAHEQFKRAVLLDDGYYNSWIMVKVHRSHLKNVNLSMEDYYGKEECGCARRSRELERLFEELGEEPLAWNAEGDASRLHGGSTEADAKPAEGDRSKEESGPDGTESKHERDE